MTAKDKDYIDRQYNMTKTELGAMEERLKALESRPVTVADGNGTTPISTKELVEIMLEALHICLQQRQERMQAEDKKAREEAAEKYRQETERQRQEVEARGDTFFENDREWMTAIQKMIHEFLTNQQAWLERIAANYGNLYNFLKSRLSKKQASTTSVPTTSIFSDLPNGFSAAFSEIRHRVASRIRTYLTGHFSLPRGWTILIILLYILLILSVALVHISITIKCDF